MLSRFFARFPNTLSCAFLQVFQFLYFLLLLLSPLLFRWCVGKITEALILTGASATSYTTGRRAEPTIFASISCDAKCGWGNVAVAASLIENFSILMDFWVTPTALRILTAPNAVIYCFHYSPYFILQCQRYAKGNGTILELPLKHTQYFKNKKKYEIIEPLKNEKSTCSYKPDDLSIKQSIKKYVKRNLFNSKILIISIISYKLHEPFTFWRKKDVKYGNYNQKVIQDLRINNHETPSNNQYDCMHTCWMLVFMI